MMIPPFRGPGKAMLGEVADEYGCLHVDSAMRVRGADRIYAAGDAASFLGPRMVHLAVEQGEVAAANIAAEIEGRAPEASYQQELRLVIDEGGKDSIYLRHELWGGGEPGVRQERFWGWAKRLHARYWQRQHS